MDHRDVIVFLGFLILTVGVVFGYGIFPAMIVDGGVLIGLGLAAHFVGGKDVDAR